MVRCEGASKEWRRFQTGCGERERRRGHRGTARNGAPGLRHVRSVFCSRFLGHAQKSLICLTTVTTVLIALQRLKTPQTHLEETGLKGICISNRVPPRGIYSQLKIF